MKFVEVELDQVRTRMRYLWSLVKNLGNFSGDLATQGRLLVEDCSKEPSWNTATSGSKFLASPHCRP